VRDELQLKDDVIATQAPTSVVYVLNSDTLETVIRKMAEHRIHRVFVVDDEQHKRPTRVLAQCDIIQNVLRT
jgi:CBS domain-containing protein